MSGNDSYLYISDSKNSFLYIQPGVWHSMAVLTPHVICFEVKPGPYSAATDKDFAPWAPREGDAGTGAYLDGLVSSVKPSMG